MSFSWDPDTSTEISHPVEDAQLAQVLKIVPKGALTIAGIALALLMLAWLAVYFLVFLPRGPIS